VPEIGTVLGMATNNDIDDRLTEVEGDVRTAVTTSEHAYRIAEVAERVVDGVVAKLNLHKKLLLALRETQIEQDQTITGLDRKADKLDLKVDKLDTKVDKGFVEMREGFAKVDQNFAKVDQNFAKVEETFMKMAIGQAEITALLNRVIEDK
jgi:hypothetical protein